MEIKLRDFVEQVFSNRNKDVDNPDGLGVMFQAMLGSSPGTVRVRVKQEVDYVQLVLPVPDPSKIIPFINLFSDAYDFSYVIETDSVLLNFYKVPGIKDITGIVVNTENTHIDALMAIGQLLSDLHASKEIYAQLEGFYSSMEKFMFMVEGLKSYRLIDVQRFLNEELCQIADLEKFAIYISEINNTQRLRLVSWSPKEVGDALSKSIELKDLEKVTDYFIIEMEMNNIQGYFLYRPQTYAKIDDDFLYLVNYTVSKSIENSVLFEEKKFLAEKDALTGLYNRRYFFDAMTNAVYNAKRYNQKMSLLMFDIDDFKHINDTYGHVVGDKVLKAIGGVMSRTKRHTDIFGRYGGEEFIALCNGIDLEDCLKVGERVRQEVSGLRFDGIDDLRVTISVGTASYKAVMNMEGDPADNLVKWADKALYKSKEAGKNQVTACEDLLKLEMAG